MSTHAAPHQRTLHPAVGATGPLVDPWSERRLSRVDVGIVAIAFLPLTYGNAEARTAAGDRRALGDAGQRLLLRGPRRVRVRVGATNALNDAERTAGAVRKAVERFCREFASTTGVHLKKGMKVDDMIERLHQHKAIDALEVGTLHRLCKFGNRGAHDDATVNPAASAILSNVNALRELQARHLTVERTPALKLIAGGGEGPAATA